MVKEATLEDLAHRAVGGDRDAVHRLVRALQGDIYGLALRMPWHREDAEDAAQEILVRVVTRLALFDFRSRLRTWVYRVAANYLLDVKKSSIEKQSLTFDRFADDLAEGQSAAGPADEERALLVEEVKIGCTVAMLQCLDRPHRLAYVLGEVLDFSAPEGAEALGIHSACVPQAPTAVAGANRVVHTPPLRARLRICTLPVQPPGARRSRARPGPA